MYVDFSFIGLDTDIRTKSIILEFSKDIDPETVSDESVEIFNRQTRNDVVYSYEVKCKKIYITLKEWPIPNIDYIISIQNIKSITGDILDSGIKRPIVFKSDLLSTITITYPAFEEEIKDLKLSWQENVQDNTSPCNSYYIEIATDNAFNNIVLKTTVSNRNTVFLTSLTDGQYYVRVRVDNENMYGLWSYISTFIVTDNPQKIDPVYNDSNSDNEPIYVQELKIIDRSEDGTTPKSLVVEFEDDLDPDSIDDIIVIRRQI